MSDAKVLSNGRLRVNLFGRDAKSKGSFFTRLFGRKVELKNSEETDRSQKSSQWSWLSLFRKKFFSSCWNSWKSSNVDSNMSTGEEHNSSRVSVPSKDYHTPLLPTPRSSIHSLPDEVDELREEHLEKSEVAAPPASDNFLKESSVKETTQKAVEQQSLESVFTKEQLTYLRNILNQPPGSQNSSIEERCSYDVENKRDSIDSNSDCFYTSPSSPRSSIHSLPDEVDELREEHLEKSEVAAPPASDNFLKESSVKETTQKAVEQQSLESVFTKEQLTYLRNILNQLPGSQVCQISTLREVFNEKCFVERNDIAISLEKKDSNLEIKVSLSLGAKTKGLFLKFFIKLFFSSLRSLELFSDLTDEKDKVLSEEYQKSAYNERAIEITHVNFTILLNQEERKNAKLSVELPGWLKKALDSAGIEFNLETIFAPPWILGSFVNISKANDAIKNNLDVKGGDPNSGPIAHGFDLATSFQELASIINDDRLYFKVDFTTDSSHNEN